VPCCSKCSGAKGNKDFETWLPHRFENWENTLETLRAYAGGIAEDPPLPPAIAAETETELEKYWAIRDRVFDLLREADEIAARIHALRPSTNQTSQPDRGPQVKGDGSSYNPSSGTIGWFCIKLLAEQWQDEDILAEVRRKFPGAKTGKKSLAWYKTKLRRMPEERIDRIRSE
jgi:hypothetical protein